MADRLSYLIVDGHSVMHAWPELRRRQGAAASRHAAQRELLKRLRDYQDQSGTQVVVVFDGTHAQRSEEREPQGLQIIYAEAGTTADARLEAITCESAPNGQPVNAAAKIIIRQIAEAYRFQFMLILLRNIQRSRRSTPGRRVPILWGRSSHIAASPDR